MREIELKYLPEYSPWIAHLLGLTDFKVQTRDLTKIEAEYNKDKYAKLLAYYKNHRDLTMKDIKDFSLQHYASNEICVSRDNKLFLANPDEFQQLEDSIFLDTFTELIDKTDAVVELGCGYGYNLMALKAKWPTMTYVGGEYSTNAIELANMLFGANIVKYFNFYDAEWPLLEAVRGHIIVFTKHAIEQLPSARETLATLAKYRGRVSDIVHFEPVYELIDNAMLGLLRQSYTHLNDYNRDLLTVIREIGGDIQQIYYDLCGRNPLNPTSLIHWRLH